MGYDRGDGFPFDFEPNGFPFGSKSKGKPSSQPYPIRFERKYSFLSANRMDSGHGIEIVKFVRQIICTNMIDQMKLDSSRKIFFSHKL